MAKPKKAAPAFQDIFVSLHIKQVFHALDHTLEEAFRPHGLSLPQWGFLRVIQEQPGIPGAQVAREYFMTPQAASTMLSRLEGLGFIERKAGKGKTIETYLTAQGRKLVTLCNKEAERIEREMLTSFRQQEVTTLKQGLLRCLDGLSGK
jgi:DNA-binding MarR family transcriptional regulator